MSGILNNLEKKMEERMKPLAEAVDKNTKILEKILEELKKIEQKL